MALRNGVEIFNRITETFAFSGLFLLLPPYIEASFISQSFSEMKLLTEGVAMGQSLFYYA
jgi:hypothetical protein